MTTTNVPVVRASIGSKVPLMLRIRERRDDSSDGSFFSAFSVGVNVTGPKGEIVVNGQTTVYLSTGQYFYNFDTAGLKRGNYLVKFLIGINPEDDAVQRTAVVVLE